MCRINIDKSYIEKLSWNIFNYYNGRINIINYPARLIIDWNVRYDKESVGYSRNPNVITIYPVSLARFCSNSIEEYKVNLLHVIVHELFHTDQEICYVKYTADPVYKKYIESQCELESYLHTLQHIEEMKTLFGIHADLIDMQLMRDRIAVNETGRIYKRRTYLSHFMSMMQDIVDAETSPLLDVLWQQLNISDSIINMQISNQVEFNIKNKTLGMPLPQLNEILYNYIFQYKLRSMTMNMHLEDKITTLSIDFKGKQSMCRVVTQDDICHPELLNSVIYNGVLF